MLVIYNQHLALGVQRDTLCPVLTGNLIRNVLSLPNSLSTVIVPSCPTLIVDGTLVKTESRRPDLKVFYIPATRTALELGNTAITNLVLLGAYLGDSKMLPIDAVEVAIEERMAAARGGIKKTRVALPQQSNFERGSQVDG